MRAFFQKFFDVTFLKFILVGVANTVFGAGIMFLFYNLFHFSYWISSASNYFFGSILSFFLNKNFTFQSKEGNRATLIRFVLNILACYALAYGLAKPAMKLLLTNSAQNVQENCAMLVGMCSFTAFNYIGQRFFVFQKKEPR